MKTCAIVTLVLFAVGCGHHAEKVVNPLDGKWQPTSIELGTMKFPEAMLKSTSLTIEGDKYTVMAESPDKGTTKVDTKVTPKTMDITGTDGPNKGKTFLCIYELDGDTLKVCYDLEGKNRPTEFKASGPKIMLATYQRVK